MRTASPAAASALAALYTRDGPFLERSLGHLTGDALRTLDRRLLREYQQLQIDDFDGSASTAPEEECHLALAHACLRRLAHRHLVKRSERKACNKVWRDASDRPSNWHEALGQLKVLATTDEVLDKGKLWRLVLDHPVTSYVPVQCQACGHVVPDQYPPQQPDAEVGLREVPPTGDELELRGGWFRGPRKAVTFELTCPKCRHISKWYRSGHPKIILNPDRWGRLCGEQEDLRWALAAYLEVPVRIVVPLDWDHVWSEYSAPLESASALSSPSEWQVHDGSARNFCCRLDEGIGSWTRVVAIHRDPGLCEDVTQAYLSCRRNGGRADDRVSRDVDGNRVMRGYKERVRAAREDASGELTQAKTVNGHVLERARMSDKEITSELRRAAIDYGAKEWWQPSSCAEPGSKLCSTSRVKWPRERSRNGPSAAYSAARADAAAGEAVLMGCLG